jgi:hypothetical protein
VIFTAGVMESCIIWYIKPCSPLKINRRSGGKYCFHLQGQRRNQCFCNYRTISLLPAFSKIIEKIIYKRLYSHLNKNNIVTCCLKAEILEAAYTIVS